MLNDLAQKIAESVSDVISHDVIFTDEKALIIGASDISRIGTMHEASLRVIETGKPNESYYFLNHKGSKPGITLPLEFSGKTIGSVGITGERSEVEKIAVLVKRQSELMLKESIYLETSLLREQALTQFIQDVLIFDHNKSNNIILKARAIQLGYNFNNPYIVIAIKLLKKDSEINLDKSNELCLQSVKQKELKIIKNIFSNINDVIIPLSREKYVVLYSLNYKYKEKNFFQEIEDKSMQVINSFKLKGTVSKIGIGSVAENLTDIKSSYKWAWKSMGLGEKVKNNVNIYNIEEFYLEHLISDMNKEECKYFTSKLLKELKKQNDYFELSKTILAWFESGFSQSEAAKILYIHRNTFIHRLNKISELTERDLKNIRNAHVLYLAVLIEEVMNEDKE
ncbi:carbohydrate diacid regulator [Desulfonispora thiosulfatigenes DSM 11270]|uniref:Carbohydrate diacid regulator n=1 Tax=Desulfonispora thiosulfatigenes DSM 11270 TaxID=656914 RepID=A0A1W1VHI3_DESTI|nr:sugar diacid recognition domain-containing protein [Desulfonispora thiosulfatigenes]SMB92796.1 carbohydrate diacid regulator [Desulfonispora thiosulfatigenes DSM 11270]